MAPVRLINNGVCRGAKSRRLPFHPRRVCPELVLSLTKGPSKKRGTGGRSKGFSASCYCPSRLSLFLRQRARKGLDAIRGNVRCRVQAVSGGGSQVSRPFRSRGHWSRRPARLASSKARGLATLKRHAFIVNLSIREAFLAEGYVLPRKSHCAGTGACVEC